MATRLEIQARRQALSESIRRACQDGSWPPGMMLPGVRELGEKHEVSANVVFQVIQSLVDEGVLYTVPRVGAFVGRPVAEAVRPYLIVMTEHNHGRDSLWVQVQTGFEDRIAQLGGNSLVLTPAEARMHRQNGDLPPLSGVFVFEQLKQPRVSDWPDVHAVGFGAAPVDSVDHINFDDCGGGGMATRYLWQNGHRRIAFIGLHGDDESGAFTWSLRREMGWRQAMEQAGESTEGLAFHPVQPSEIPQGDQAAVGNAMAQGLIGRSDISAVIVVNSLSLKGVLEAFQNSDWPAKEWPAVMCFDAPGAGNTYVTHLRLPWEDIGREAAQLLWERQTGRLAAEPEQRLVPMRLVPRLSCRPDWAVASGLILRQVSG